MLDGQPAVLNTRLVNNTGLADALPADTAVVSAEQRVAQMWARFNGIRRRYALL